MSLIPWTTKKQLFFLSIFLVIIIIASTLIFLSLRSATCFDGKKNQGEEGTDCGGPCEPCVGEVKDLIILWSKVFKLTDGEYEAAALIDNPNLFSGIQSIKYKFKIYDEKNILTDIKSGETFVNPDEKFLLFESDINVVARIPKYAFIEFEENPDWKRIENEKPQLSVSKKQFYNTEPFPKLIVQIDNKSLFLVDDISVAAIAYNEEQNAEAVSVSRIDSINGNSSKEIIFTWPHLFSKEPHTIEVLLRDNITH